ncbi:O-methyltransferase [Colletotrichum navitas]|uniref:O-methyltransferase n=1 Tax=Colletotrichum navitas TaxID=681940 RepID=A0AAD8PNM6_9PEZI|nr:O-methyltransferase [Colletotrichum navitas]KAK1572874.1 O-methyltransferase [Colletotrichum navitas]
MASETDTSSDAVHAFLEAANGIDEPITNEDDRSRVLMKLYELTNKVESPWDTFVRMYMNQPMVSGVLRVLRDVRLFERWQQNGNSPMTTVELAGLTDRFDPALLQRLLRLLVANNLVEVTSDGKYKPGGFCMKLAESDFDTAIKFYDDYHLPMCLKMPAYFAETGYQNPSNSRRTVFNLTFGFEGGLFRYFEKNPREGEVFNIAQRSGTSELARWTSIYPSDALLHDVDTRLPILVDVGGSIGQDIQCFLERHPGTASRVYLEDVPAVIEDVNSTLAQGVHRITYDFFTPQPIEHARAYYMHHILHDWPDKQARKILENQKAAMKPGYSKILIHDIVISGPDHPFVAVADLLMMNFGASKERTEEEWEELVRSAGLKIVKIWRVPSAKESVIEVELAPEMPRL